MSLRRRVLVGFLAVAVVLVVTNIVLASRLRTFLLDRVDHQLVDVAARAFTPHPGPGPDFGSQSAAAVTVGGRSAFAGTTFTMRKPRAFNSARMYGRASTVR